MNNNSEGGLLDTPFIIKFIKWLRSIGDDPLTNYAKQHFPEMVDPETDRVRPEWARDKYKQLKRKKLRPGDEDWPLWQMLERYWTERDPDVLLGEPSKKDTTKGKVTYPYY
jgi:hypothetical protein